MTFSAVYASRIHTLYGSDSSCGLEPDEKYNELDSRLIKKVQRDENSEGRGKVMSEMHHSHGVDESHSVKKRYKSCRCEKIQSTVSCASLQDEDGL